MNKNKQKHGFSLSEMMVVMLIMTVVLAASVPIITKRARITRNSIWNYSSDLAKIYYGTYDTDGVAIGASNYSAGDNAKLLIKQQTQPKTTYYSKWQTQQQVV